MRRLIYAGDDGRTPGPGCGNGRGTISARLVACRWCSACARDWASFKTVREGGLYPEVEIDSCA